MNGFQLSSESNSDTEVVLYGVIHLGIDEFLRKADGMFAFAIYNKSQREVILARDRVGKPLYFFKSKEGLSFASELKALGEILMETCIGYYWTAIVFDFALRSATQFFREFQNWRRDTIFVFQIKTNN